ncbi:MAG: DUF1501 domain-containing protein [Kiritimatiellia bacterium]|nr:DUF1501 domain-containing protein [Kiritimatiellia bacterium]MDP6811205.1 DUF1501 domain-containing protein [Kiritimatiellia bacterium]MDP7024350.1 DUF1501 domain-containing protein [Kiritimatiellia bacterium]
MTMTRRDMLKSSLAGAAGLALYDPLLARAVAPVPRAKSVIQIWMWGGPTHLDTFDPKPDAGYDYCGPYDKPIGTNVDGIQIGQALPKLAQQADKYSILRGMTHGVNGHETASYLVQTGHKSGDGMVYPSVGGVVSYFKGYRAGYEGLIPPYIVLTKPQGRFSEAGFLGTRYKPFATGGNPSRDPFVVEGVVAAGISRKRQEHRRKLLNELDTLGRQMKGNAAFAASDRSQAQAYDLILGDAGKVFDLTEEPDDVRARYGRHEFGQSCLLARRLVERGVPYVTINYRGWDTHKQHFQSMQRQLPQLDSGLATLFADLSERGLLDSTIVWWGGEFGRTPKIQWDPPWNGGRGHFGKAFSSVVGGGGFAGGQMLGATDEKGENVVERKIYPRDLIGSIYELLGIDPAATLPHPQGLNVKAMPEASDGQDAGRLYEIMKGARA